MRDQVRALRLLLLCNMTKRRSGVTDLEFLSGLFARHSAKEVEQMLVDGVASGKLPGNLLNVNYVSVFADTLDMTPSQTSDLLTVADDEKKKSTFFTKMTVALKTAYNLVTKGAGTLRMVLETVLIFLRIEPLPDHIPDFQACLMYIAVLLHILGKTDAATLQKAVQSNPYGRGLQIRTESLTSPITETVTRNR